MAAVKTKVQKIIDENNVGMSAPLPRAPHSSIASLNHLGIS